MAGEYEFVRGSGRRTKTTMSARHPFISVAVPLHNEAGNIRPLYGEIRDVLDALGTPYEIILVNDASTDETPGLLRVIQASDPTVRVIEHQENYGQAAGLSTAFHAFRGEILVTLDGDGQNDPHDIPLLLDKLRQGYTVATGWRTRREERYLTRILPSRLANRIIALVTGVHVHDNGCSLKAYRAEAVAGVTIAHGFHRFLPAILGVTTQDVAEVAVSDRKRLHGQSHYGLKRVREVLRDLLSFYCVRHNPQAWEKRLRWLAAGGGGATLVLACSFAYTPRTDTLIALLVCLALAGLIGIVWSNVLRVLSLGAHQTVSCREVTSESLAVAVTPADAAAESTA